MTARWPRAVRRSERSSSPIFLKLTVFLPMSMLVSSSSWTTKAGLSLESAECTSLPIQKILIVWLLTWPPTPEKRLVAVSANYWAKVQGWQGPLRAHPPSRTVEADPGQWWHRPEQWHRCHPHRWPSSLGHSLLTEGAGIAASHGRAVDQLHLPWQVKSKPVCPRAQRILGVQCLDPSLLAIPCGFQTWWRLHRCCAQMELQDQAVNHQLGEAARCQGPCPPKLERLGAHAKYAKATTGRSHTAKIQDLGFAKSSWHLPCRTQLPAGAEYFKGAGRGNLSPRCSSSARVLSRQTLLKSFLIFLHLADCPNFARSATWTRHDHNWEGVLWSALITFSNLQKPLAPWWSRRSSGYSRQHCTYSHRATQGRILQYHERSWSESVKLAPEQVPSSATMGILCSYLKDLKSGLAVSGHAQGGRFGLGFGKFPSKASCIVSIAETSEGSKTSFGANTSWEYTWTSKFSKDLAFTWASEDCGTWALETAASPSVT